MYDHLTQVCGEVVALDPKPTAAIINGDCAYLHGEIADYQTLLKPLATLRERGLPLHLTMGNHDNREHLWKTIADSESHVEPLPDRQVMVLEFPRAISSCWTRSMSPIKPRACSARSSFNGSPPLWTARSISPHW